MQCKPKNETPCEIERGYATSDHQFAYFTPENSTSVYSYEWSTELWRELPSCRCHNSALIIINDELTTVGGGSGSHYSSHLITLRRRKWVNEYPTMKTGRSKPAVVSTSDGDYIIVIGGLVRYGWTTTVELFQVKTRQWYELTNLPRTFTRPSVTICGNQICVISGDRVIGYLCSLQALPSSDEPITSESLPDLLSWAFLPRLPVIDPTIATLSGQLVLIGGKRVELADDSVRQLVNGQWVEIGSMTCGRWGCLSVSPSPDRVMIVGGEGARAQFYVEECVVVVSDVD